MGFLRKIFENKQKNQKEQELKKTQKKTEKQLTFTKVAIAFVLVNSELQIWASYLLAFLGRDAIAEALSQQIVVTIIGTMIGYFVKSLLENLSKYTTLFGKNLEMENEEVKYFEDMNQEICVDEDVYQCQDMLCDGITVNYSDEDIEVGGT